MFSKFTPSAEDIKVWSFCLCETLYQPSILQKQYDEDPVSRQLFKNSMEKQNRLRRAAFEQAGISVEDVTEEEDKAEE